MHQIENYTPFETFSSPGLDKQGADILIVGLKATFMMAPVVKLAEEQLPFVLADEYLGEPGRSSLARASEILPLKPGSDVLLSGHAYSPQESPVEVIDTRLSIGETSKTVRVFGDRLWIHGGISDTAPFETMALTYENAFGGLHHFKPEEPLGPNSSVSVAANPVGKGFIGQRSKQAFLGQALPNLEDPRYLIRVPSDQPQPMAYGPICGDWVPRKQFAGTYDEQWMKTRAPILPLDFDERYLLNGSTGLSFERRYFNGGEPVRLQNLAPLADIQFNLPRYEPKSFFKLNGSWHETRLVIETIHFEPDANVFTMIWKTQFQCSKRSRQVSHIRLELPQESASQTLGQVG